ncbi:MAG: DUF4393 domain-containing protein [Desulfobacteraceae bacterium]|nr:DUF4393 domain-containing protein [Desulfobacteraceae bacterium]
MDNMEQKALEQIANKASEFVDEIIKPPLKEVGGLLADSVRFWRYKNQVNIILKAKEFLEKKRIKPKKIPIKSLASLLENSSLEEEESMQIKWASLLANAANPEHEHNDILIFSQILKELSPEEALMLDYIASQSFIRSSEDRAYVGRRMLIAVGKKYSSSLVLLENLIRLKLIEQKASEIIIDRDALVDNGSEYINVNYKESDEFRLTILGAEFIKQCKFQE